MKVIDLLNKIANGEAPERILYDGYIWSWTGDDYRTILKDEKEQFLITGMYYTWLSEFLKQEVEIIEEDKKINKIRIDYNSVNIDKAFEKGTTTFFRGKDIEIFQCLSAKINELIDEVNKLKENK